MSDKLKAAKPAEPNAAQQSTELSGNRFSGLPAS